MNDLPSRTTLAIVGAGPVGLLLANLLDRLDLDFIVLEREPHASTHSRAIGVHPTSLELFDELGLARTLIERGVVVRTIKAYREGRELGSLSFNGCRPPFNFILSIPQGRTETVLETALAARRPLVLHRGVELLGLEREKGGLRLALRDASGEHRSLLARYLVGCDGKASLVRRLAGIQFDGGPYSETFVMGDFEETTDLGQSSAIHLQAGGVVEAFPLPERRRRWVARTDSFERAVTTHDVAALVRDRVGHSLFGADSFMVSAFQTQRFVARTLARGGVLLAGDAGHIVSPSIGQGMNLGFLDAWRLARALAEIGRRPRAEAEALERYSRLGRRAARRAIVRAELYMLLCRDLLPSVCDRLIQLMLDAPIHDFTARLFTMRGLARPGFSVPWDLIPVRSPRL